MSSLKKPRPRANLLNLPPYVPGKSAIGSTKVRAKLSSNESPLGASPDAVRAYEIVGKRLAIYPDPGAVSLRSALGQVHGLDPEQIVVGAGSDELLHLLAEAYLEPGDNAVTSEFGFLMYPIATQAAGGEVRVAKDRDFVVDVDAMLAQVDGRTRLVWLANPGNPTGTYLSAAEVERLHAGLPSNVILVIDNAYAEYVTAADFDTGAALADRADNVVMVRTFSKVGLAAARVGWLFGPVEIVDVLNRLRGPFNVSAPAQAAAEAATRDVEFNEKLRAHNHRWRTWLSERLNSNRVRVLPSQGNFILALFNDATGMRASDAFAALGAQGVIVREMHSYNLPNALRISIGTKADMETVADILAPFAEGAA